MGKSQVVHGMQTGQGKLPSTVNLANGSLTVSQMKCDVRANFPAPCTRCKKKDFDCTSDANFKRIPTRGRLDEVVSKLAKLERALEKDKVAESSTHHHPSPRQHGGSNSLRPQPPERLIERSLTVEDSSPIGSSTLGNWIDSFEDDGSGTDSWTLDDFALPCDSAIALFKYFGQHFYCHIPILERKSSLAALYDTDNLLFWTIILVACKRHSDYTGLHKQLLWRYKTLLGAAMLKSARSVSTIHALLILCLWPGVVAPEAEDPSWHFCGLAVNSALQMFLHHARSPQYFDGFGISTNVEATEKVRAMTWMACFQISTTISCFLGLPPQFSSSSQLDALASLYVVANIPRNFLALTEIQRHVARFMGAMGNVHDSRVLQSLVQHFDGDLESVRERFADAWSQEAEFNLQSAKVYLFALCFLSEYFSPDDNSIPPESFPATLRVLILSGVVAAVRLIHIFSEIGASSTNGLPDDPKASYSFVFNYPKMYLGRIFFAAVYLLKYLATSSQAFEPDRSLAQNHVTAAYQLFIRYTGDGERTRGAKLIELLGRILKPGGRPAKLHVKDRFGASLCYDAFWEAEKMGNRVQSPVNSSAPSHGQNVTATTPTDTGSLLGAQAQNLIGTQSISELSQLPVDTLSSFPWGIWDDTLYQELQIGQNDFDQDMLGFVHQ